MLIPPPVWGLTNVDKVKQTYKSKRMSLTISPSVRIDIRDIGFGYRETVVRIKPFEVGYRKLLISNSPLPISTHGVHLSIMTREFNCG
jgi:hypothetical protein